MVGEMIGRKDMAGSYARASRHERPEAHAALLRYDAWLGDKEALRPVCSKRRRGRIIMSQA